MEQDMAAIIDRKQVRGLLARGATLVDVLPEGSFAEAHLPGAINLPLKHLDRDSVTDLDPSDPVIVYCHDSI
jgi:rhodanese-related sulfurtransferase